jgi:hypothetical protein
MITFFSSRVIARERSRTFVIESVVVIYLAPCVSGTLTERLNISSTLAGLLRFEIRLRIISLTPGAEPKGDVISQPTHFLLLCHLSARTQSGTTLGNNRSKQNETTNSI